MKKALVCCANAAIEKNSRLQKKFIIGPLIQNYMLNHLIKFQDGFSTITFSTIFLSKATIFLFLGLRISWPEKRVGRSGKKKNSK